MAVHVSMAQMLEAGVHFGHQTRYWNPKMADYIYGSYQGVHIINLEETLPRFREVLRFVHNLANRRGKLLFVGTKHAAREVICEEATRCGMPYVDHRWLGGMLTNYKTIRQSIKRLRELDEQLETAGALSGMTKKAISNLMRERDKLHANLSGIKNMGGLPDALFVVDVMHERIAIEEARRLGIPVIGVVDTNADPKDLDFMIPGNDDAVRAIRLYSAALADTILEVRSEVEAAHMKEAPVVAETEVPKQKVVTRKVKTATKASPKVVDEAPASEPVSAP